MGILDDAIREHLELKRRHGADSNEVSRQEREILGGGGEPLPDEEPIAAYQEPADPVFAPEPLAEAPAPLETEAPYAGSPLDLTPAPEAPVQPSRGDIFPGTGELLAAANETPLAPAPAPAAPAPAAPAAPSLGAPAPSGADSETAARSGARRLSDDELAAWRRRLSERADRLAAQRPGTPDAAPAGGTAPATPAAAAPKSEPPAYWSGNSTGADAGAPPQRPLAPRIADTGVHPAAPPESGVPVDFFEAGDAENAFAPEAAPAPEADADVLDQTPDFLEETPEHDRMWFEQKPPRDFDFG